MGVLDAGCVSGPNAKKYGLEGPHNVVLWLTFRPQHNAPPEPNMHLLCVTPHMGNNVPQHHHVRLHGLFTMTTSWNLPEFKRRALSSIKGRTGARGSASNWYLTSYVAIIS